MDIYYNMDSPSMEKEEQKKTEKLITENKELKNLRSLICKELGLPINAENNLILYALRQLRLKIAFQKMEETK